MKLFDDKRTTLIVKHTGSSVNPLLGPPETVTLPVRRAWSGRARVLHSHLPHDREGENLPRDWRATFSVGRRLLFVTRDTMLYQGSLLSKGASSEHSLTSWGGGGSPVFYFILLFPAFYLFVSPGVYPSLHTPQHVLSTVHPKTNADSDVDQRRHRHHHRTTNVQYCLFCGYHPYALQRYQGYPKTKSPRPHPDVFRGYQQVGSC